jgi:electron transport complex protein RnfA
MSYIGIVLSAVFATNAMLVYGFGRLPGSRNEGEGWFPSMVALVLINALSSLLFWVLRNLVLVPLGIGSMDLFIFVLIAIPAMKSLTRLSSSGKGLFSQIAFRADELVVGTLSFGIALIASRSGYRMLEALAASAASGLGYWLASVVLEGIRQRLELSPVPVAFRGAPAMIVSAGLIAMAFMGIDAILIKNLAG